MRPLAFIVLALSLAAPAMGAERSFPVGRFDQVRAAGPFDVAIHVGGPASVRATGPDEALSRIIVTVEDGQLVIRSRPNDRFDWGSWFRRNQRIVVDVRVPALRGVALAGSGNVSVDTARAPAFAASLSGSGDLTVGTLQSGSATIDLKGSGDLNLSGRAENARVTLAGSGNLDAGGLAADDANVALMGSGDVTLGARRTATVSLTGSGNVTITGPARCVVAKRGSGEVRCGR